MVAVQKNVGPETEERRNGERTVGAEMEREGKEESSRSRGGGGQSYCNKGM